MFASGHVRNKQFDDSLALALSFVLLINVLMLFRNDDLFSEPLTGFRICSLLYIVRTSHLL